MTNFEDGTARSLEGACQEEFPSELQVPDPGPALLVPGSHAQRSWSDPAEDGGRGLCHRGP